MGNIDTGYKIVRDPLYGYIGLTEREVKLIDTDWFQRLRRIKQLAMTELVYPSAVHTRFEHSLGVLHVADMMALQLKLDNRDREIVRSAALLHDIGHGPFSHVFENILEIANNNAINHEQISLKILETKDIKSILSEGENIFGNVYSIFADQERESVIRYIISGALDADKIDYLRRDSYHTGVMYGVFDFDRIVRMLELEERPLNEQYIAVKEKGRDALESFRLARYLMHKQVYQHHVRAIADSMLTRAAKLHINSNSASNKMSFSDDNFLSYFRDYDDFSFLYELNNSPCKDARELIERLRTRKLLKRCYEKDVREIGDHLIRKRIAKMNRQDFECIEHSIAQTVSINSNFVIVYPIRIKNPVYRDPDEYIEEEILIKTVRGKIESFKETSPISGSQEKLVEKLLVFSPLCLDEERKNLEKVVERKIEDLA